MGMAIACSDLAIRPLILVQTALDAYGKPQPGVNTPQSYDPNTDFMCIRFADPADGISKWFCGAGQLGDGVVGVATTGPNLSPRSFFVKSTTWGQNTWTRHWEWKNIFQAISTRDPLPNGFALNNAWNLHPNDFHGDGVSKARSYVAAISLKTQTNRSGVQISPYHTRNVQNAYAANPSGVFDTLALAQQNPGELNQGEVDISNCGSSPYPSPGCTDYFWYYDSSSQGIAGTCYNSATCAGDLYGLVDVQLYKSYADQANQDPVVCSFANDWRLTIGETTPLSGTSPLPIKAKNWAANPLGTVTKNIRVPTTSVPYALAINRAEGEVQRCPSWNLCSSTLHNAVLIAYDANWNRMYSVRDYPFGVSSSATPQRSTLRFGGWTSSPTCGSVNYFNQECPYDTHKQCAAGFSTSAPCEQFYCGMPLPAVTTDKSLVDWYVCSSGAACLDYAQSDSGIWSVACTDAYKCSIPMGNDDTYVIAWPAAFRGSPNAWLSWSAIYGR